MTTKDFTKQRINFRKTKNRILPNLPEFIFTTKFTNHFIDKIENIHKKLQN